MHRACKRLGLPPYGHHSMRHFFCSNCLEAGVDFLTLSRWLGHSDGGVLVGKTYGHLRQEHSLAMAKRVTFDVTSDEAELENIVSIAS
jgi:site-specific recombinase XerD